MTRPETSDRIARTAARWVARMDRAPLSESEEAELRAWLDADPRRLGALARAQATLARMERAQALSGLPSGVSSGRGGWLTRRRLIGGGAGLLAASLTALAMIGWIDRGHPLATARGEVRIAALPDGSRMTLDTATALRTRFSSAERHVDLIAGRASFDVAKDAERPFVVRAGDTEVRAIGTRFSVSIATDRSARVIVQEGKVAIRSLATQTDGAPQFATANMMVEMAPAARSPQVAARRLTPEDVARRSAWQDGMLEFEATRLDEAARQFAAYSAVEIRIANPALARQRITGRFSTTDPRGFARAVALGLNARAVPDGSGVLITP